VEEGEQCGVDIVVHPADCLLCREQLRVGKVTIFP